MPVRPARLGGATQRVFCPVTDSGPTDYDLPVLEPGDLEWRPASVWRFSGPLELKSGDATIAEAEWLDAEPPEWRVDAGQRELAFRVVEWKPMRIEVAAIPGGAIEMVHRASKSRPRPPIEIGDVPYYLVKSGGRTSYLDADGAVIAHMFTRMSWHGGRTVSVQDTGCPPWHSWILACYEGFRIAVSYRYFFKGGGSSGLGGLIGRARDYDLGSR